MSTEFREAADKINQVLYETHDDEFTSKEYSAFKAIRMAIKEALPTEDQQAMLASLAELQRCAERTPDLVDNERYNDPIWLAWCRLGETLSGDDWSSSSAIC